MRYKLAGILTICMVSLAGCNTANDNRVAYNTNANMANTNMRANANTEMANANANENTNMRRGPTREEYERDKARYQREAKESGRSVGTGINDGWLWVKTRFDLAAADDLRDSTINVDVNNDVVTLTGTVATAEQKARAEQIAKSVEGVKSVKNVLKVSPSGNSNTNTTANKNTNTRKY